MNQGEMAVMGREGDTKFTWSRDNPDEVENARQTFNQYVREKKYAAFKVRMVKGSAGEKGEQVREFDPDAEAYIFVPPMRGG